MGQVDKGCKMLEHGGITKAEGQSLPALILGRSAQKAGLSTQETAAYQKREIGKAEEPP